MTQIIPTAEDFLARTSAQLADSLLPVCPACGRSHLTPFRAIYAAPGAVNTVPQLAERLLERKPSKVVVIYDHEIAALIESAVIEPLRQGGLPVTPYAMRGEPGHLLDSGVVNGDAAAAEIGAIQADLLVAAGSGVICDLTKWIATHLGLPFILCGTAPSMNGYTSITATMTENGVKVSKSLNPADAVVLDVDILSGAPVKMIRSGLGDLAARATCNADWKLSSLLRQTYFCPLPYQMTALGNKPGVVPPASGAEMHPPATSLAGLDMNQLAETVLLSGLSMTVVGGETSPSSGAEHILSHFWDLLAEIRGLPKNFHGTQVGLGTLITLHAYDYLRQVDPSRIDPLAVLRRRPSLEEIKTGARARFGDQAEGFIHVARRKRIADTDLPAYLRSILDRWESIWQELDPYANPPASVSEPFRAAGVPMKLEDIQRSRADAVEALLWGSVYRPRYTILDLLWELGLFPQAAEEILDRAGM